MFKRWSVILLSGAVALTLTASVTPAQEGPGESFTLSLDQALRVALRNNLDLVSARFGPDFAEQDIEVQLSNYDAGFQAHMRAQRRLAREVFGRWVELARPS